MTEEIKKLIEDSITYIENKDFEMLFAFCRSRDSGELADTLMSAGINFLQDIETIGQFMFMNSKIERLKIPNNIKSIEMGAFFSCDQLTSIIIPASIKEVGIKIFERCRNLYYVRFEGTKQQFIQLNFVKEHFQDTTVEFIHCSDGDLYISELRGIR